MANMNRKDAPQTSEFKGLTGWFDIFEAGERVDSKGNARTWTHSELDSMVANYRRFPFVVGHPKSDDPAYGWGGELKREGDKLMARGVDVAPEFESAVEAQHYPERSIAVDKVDDGFRIRHLGFLGAVPPAVDTLRGIEFSSEEPYAEYQFSAESAVIETGWQLSAVGRLMRNIKNYFIESEGSERAETLLPEYSLDELSNARRNVQENLSAEDNPSNAFNADSKPDTNEEESDVSQYSEEQKQEAVEAAVAEATGPLQDQIKQLQKDKEASEFAGRLKETRTLVDSLVGDGKLLPAQTEGLAEFMAGLSSEENSFEFSSGEGDDKQQKQTSPYQFMSDLLGGLSKQLDVGKSHFSEEESLDTEDTNAIVKAAQEFQNSEAENGRTISISDAVVHVTNKGASK